MTGRDEAGALFILQEHVSREHPGTNQMGFDHTYNLDQLTKRHVWLHEYARKRGKEPEVVQHQVEQQRGLFGPRGPAYLRHA